MRAFGIRWKQSWAASRLITLLKEAIQQTRLEKSEVRVECLRALKAFEIMLRAGEVCRMTCPLFPAPNLDGIDFSTLVCWSLLQLVF